ncbi:MAG TPA: glycosyltransferase family A protein, partial [Gammaproteobacteria bacterium]|nr:glycosyltransferase family A protein [Gammaproteobacteria bacterium]
MEGEQVSISVVITTYNRAAMLDDALASVAASHADDRRTVEVLVIDNNSADNTAEVVAARQPEFPFPLFYFMEPRQGLSYARNRGISEAEGKYLVFMDDDQILDPQYLRTVPVAFEESDAACVACRLIYRCDENAPEWFNEIGRVHGEQDFGESAMTLHHDQHTVLGGTMSFRRSDLIAAGSFNVHLGRKGTQLLSGEDSEFWGAMLKRVLSDTGPLVAILCREDAQHEP